MSAPGRLLTSASDPKRTPPFPSSDLLTRDESNGVPARTVCVPGPKMAKPPIGRTAAVGALFTAPVVAPLYRTAMS